MNIKLQLQPIYLDDYLQVALDKNLTFIFIKWTQHPGSSDFRRLFQKLAELTIQNKCKYWLSDARAIHFIEFADQNWLLREMAPMLKKSNLVKFARLTTAENLAQLDVVRVMNQVEQLTGLGIGTKLDLFTNMEAALDWLFEDVGQVTGGI